MKNATVRSALAGAALSLALPAWAEPVARSLPAAGSVIARKSGEEVRFFDVSSWRYVDLAQDLLTGDVLRTNATGQLAVLFSDRTQVRLGRNTSLLVKQMGADSNTGLELQSGTIWARAERGGQGLTVDTPAAAAAIRGTDWTLTVGADGKTSLIVLEGLVELSNAFGSVQVAQGEGAVAAIGKAPSKIIIAKPKDREQMLFNLSLRDSFRWMPPTRITAQKQRAVRDRIEAKPEENRSTEDWLDLAETYIVHNGRQKTRQALENAARQGLNPRQKARSILLEAMLTGSENRYADAADLFVKAQPNLDPSRKTIARYGAFIARALADPNHIETPPEMVDSASAAIGKAWIAGFRNDTPTALAVIKAAERSNPDDATLPAARAQLAILLADVAEAKDGIERALALDPDNPTALEARAQYKMGVAFDRNGAVEDLLRAVAVAPGDSGAWNALGLAQSDRDANREAEAAFKRAIELDPLDPLMHGNLAILYLDQLRMAEAKREIDRAIELDPTFYLALVARGRYHLQTGETEKGVQDLLAGATANPGVSNAQVLLAAAHYANRDKEPAEQAIDNAERLDPHDPVVAVVRTAIAIDNYDTDAAIRNAQEIMRLTRARGGDYASLGANQTAGSTLNDAFRLQGLNAWGQYYGDAVFDPFTASSYFDQAVRGSINPFANSYSFTSMPGEPTGNDDSYPAFIQGLLLGPHMLAGSERTTNLLEEPFIETALTAGFLTGGRKTTYTGNAEVRGLTFSPFPISIYGDVTWERPRNALDLPGDTSFVFDTDIVNGSGYVTMSPTPDDRIVAYTRYDKTEDFQENLGLPLIRTSTAEIETSQLSSVVAWSHTFGYRNVANTGLFYTDSKAKILAKEIGFAGRALTYDDQGQINGRHQSYVAAFSHMVGDDDITWRYGVEGGLAKRYGASERTTIFFDGSPTEYARNEFSDQTNFARAYIDALYEVGPDLTFEAAVFGRFLETDGIDDRRLEPRLGIAWSPVENHWLRLGFIREGENFSSPTLAPLGVVGLQANQIGLADDGYTDTWGARWDAQWSDRFFTAVDYQRQTARNLSLTQPLEVTTVDMDKARIDRAAITANLFIGHGFGLSATYAHFDSENLDTSSASYGGSLIFLPEQTAQVALTWVNTANVKATVAANYTGERVGDTRGAELDDFWTLDASLSWEPLDKQIEVELTAFNLLNEDFFVATGIPGWGPTIKGTVKVRF